MGFAQRENHNPRIFLNFKGNSIINIFQSYKVKATTSNLEITKTPSTSIIAHECYCASKHRYNGKNVNVQVSVT